MKLIFLGDRMWGHSAYGKVINNLATRLKENHTIAHLPMSLAFRSGEFNMKGVLLLGAGNSPFGEDVIVNHYHTFKADMVITVKEPWVFSTIQNEAINFVPMAIIDHSPVSPVITSRLTTAFKVIAISRFGQRELKQKDIDSTYIPHGVPPVYRPLDKREECIKIFHGNPDEFRVGVVAMNRSRKMLGRMVRGFKLFVEQNPDVKTHMMLWSDLTPTRRTEEAPDIQDWGIHLIPEIMELELSHVIHWPDPKLIRRGIPEWAGEDYVAGWDMVKLYNSFDVLLHCTGGEGAGLPFTEAQACGVPVIGTNYAGGPEHIGAGLTVDADDYIIMNTPGTRYALPNIDGIAKALTKMYNTDREKLKRRAVKFASRFAWDTVVERYMNPFLEECETELYPKVTKTGVTKW